MMQQHFERDLSLVSFRFSTVYFLWLTNRHGLGKCIWSELVFFWIPWQKIAWINGRLGWCFTQPPINVRSCRLFACSTIHCLLLFLEWIIICIMQKLWNCCGLFDIRSGISLRNLVKNEQVTHLLRRFSFSILSFAPVSGSAIPGKYFTYNNILCAFLC